MIGSKITDYFLHLRSQRGCLNSFAKSFELPLDRHSDGYVAFSYLRHATLYALDAATGRELWNSGSAIMSFVDSGALAAGDGHVYVPTHDNTLYAFGVPLEH